MDKLTKYRNIIKQILKGYFESCLKAELKDDYETQLIVDEERDHYFLLTLGWEGFHRIYGSTIHIDIKNGKVWIQHDQTDFQIAEQLMEKGVAKEDIVLGFHAPYKRQFTEYATA